jgi:hypothetical protein
MTSETTSAYAYVAAPQSLQNAAPVPHPRTSNRQGQPIGYPAIRPHASTNNSATIGTESSPGFTVNDAIEYVKTHGIFKAIGAHGTVKVAKAKFMPSKAASVALDGESIGLPDDALVCYVELHGKIDFAGPSGVVVTFSRVYELFDAQSGNLLMVGGLD